MHSQVSIAIFQRIWIIAYLYCCHYTPDGLAHKQICQVHRDLEMTMMMIMVVIVVVVVVVVV